jgi:hypothetical protein
MAIRIARVGGLVQNDSVAPTLLVTPIRSNNVGALLLTDRQHRVHDAAACASDPAGARTDPYDATGIG